MRILQLAINPDWLGKSSNPAAAAQGACTAGTTLLDDGWTTITTAALAVDAVAADKALLLFSKDLDSMCRGLHILAKKKGLRLGCEKTGACVGLAIWRMGSERRMNPALAGINTVGHNIKVLLTRNDKFQSLKGNVAAAGRDGRLVQHGCAVYVCSPGNLPQAHIKGAQYEWYSDGQREWNDLTMDGLAQEANRLIRL